MHVRVDERGEALRRLDDVVEFEAHLAEHVEVGSEPRGVHDHVGVVLDELAAARADDPHAAAVAAAAVGGTAEAHDLEAVEHLDAPRRDEVVDAAPDRGARGEAVVLGCGDTHRRGVADRPRDAGPGLLACERGEREQGVRRGVACADDGHASAREAGAVGAEHVGQRVGHGVCDLVEPERVEAARAEPVGGAPGPRRIDDGPRRDILHLTGCLAHAQHERRRRAAGRAGAVHALARDGRHVDAEADARGERFEGGERFEVPLDELGSGGQAVLRWVLPPGCLEQAPRGGVDEHAPRREQADVPPLADARADAVAGLVHDDVDPALEEVRGGGQADRPCADDRDGQGVEAIGSGRRAGEVEQGHGGPFRHIEVRRCPVSTHSSKFVNVQARIGA
ncbi:hypothetical protein GCM10025870_20140 [Agromyces marinus]|uniref:Uncharacterized protein n=1 Tax=Agromyces marinus TaxID=1389020 RepID=A0ABN6YCQ2_9MICO|nr:hypothetical protein GCM10025870_20140 [Agromyces marinus]